MAISDTNNGAQQAAQPTQAVGAAPIQHEASNGGGAVGGASYKWSFGGTGGLFGAPIGRGLGSEYLTKLRDALSEIYKSASPDVEIGLLPLDNVNETALMYSALLVCLRQKKNPKAGVAYHVLVLEASGEKIAPLFEQINGQQVEIMRLPCDAVDDKLLAMAAEKVKAAYTTGPWSMVDACVIPKTFNPEDKYHVHRLALNAGLATMTELEIQNPAFEDVNVASAQHDSTLVISVGFNNSQLLDAVGEPMRSDVLVNFTSQKRPTPGQQQSINSGDRETRIAEASAFLDLVWAPVQGGAPINQWQPQAPGMTQKYAARAVITNLSSNFAYTPASILLSLVTTLSLREDNNWLQAYRPLPVGANEVDLRDIGALNIEGNLPTGKPDYNPAGYGTRIDTKMDSFRLEDLGQLAVALIQPGLVVSIDVPEAGPQTWYLSYFAAASAGSTVATSVIRQAAMELTNGNFLKYFAEGAEMFADRNNRVHLGHWVDRNGARRDIRDIDLLAVANLVGDRSPQVIRDWSDTWTRTQFPAQMRLAARKKMIHGLTNETAEFTGFAQRITFTAAFLDALARGCKDAGLTVRVNTPLSASDFNNQRGVANFIGTALMQPGQTFASGAGYGGYQSNTNANHGGNFRW